MADRTYGKTARGVPITDELVAKLANEAEEGFDVEQMLRRRRGRPPIGASAASVESVRLDPELQATLQDRAQHESATVSSLIREALRAYLAVDAEHPLGPHRYLRSSLSGGTRGSSSTVVFVGDARPQVPIAVSAIMAGSEQLAPIRRRPASRSTRILIATGPSPIPVCPGERRIGGLFDPWLRSGLGA